jgi:hypothetical protein
MICKGFLQGNMEIVSLSRNDINWFYRVPSKNMYNDMFSRVHDEGFQVYIQGCFQAHIMIRFQIMHWLR